MSRSERNFTPLSEINHQGAVEVPIWKRGSEYKTKITTHIDLPPFVDQESIGVNVTTLSRRARLGGIKSLTIVGESGEVSSYTPNVVGMSPEGGAFAGARGTAKDVKQSSSKVTNYDPIRNPFTSWADVTVKINTSEIADRHRENVRSTDAWSREINAALSREITKRGNQQLTGGGVGTVITLLDVIIGQTYGVIASAQNNIDSIIPTMIAFNTLGNVAARLGVHLRNGDTDFRWSLMPGVQIDRMAALSTLNVKDKVPGTKPFVRSLAKKN